MLASYKVSVVWSLNLHSTTMGVCLTSGSPLRVLSVLENASFPGDSVNDPGLPPFVFLSSGMLLVSGIGLPDISFYSLKIALLIKSKSWLLKGTSNGMVVQVPSCWLCSKQALCSLLQVSAVLSALGKHCAYSSIRSGTVVSFTHITFALWRFGEWRLQLSPFWKWEN